MVKLKTSRSSIIMSGKHAKSVFYQGMYIINVLHVILYIKYILLRQDYVWLLS